MLTGIVTDILCQVTGRYTDAIYKISGDTGEVLWTLGGSESDFILHGFDPLAIGIGLKVGG